MQCAKSPSFTVAEARVAIQVAHSVLFERTPRSGLYRVYSELGLPGVCFQELYCQDCTEFTAS